MTTDATARHIAANCLCFRSRRVSRLITRVYEEALRPTGLEATQVTLLSAVAIGGAEGSPMSRIADALALEISTLSRNLKPLEHAGAVEITRLPEDRRIRVARLTAKGHILLEAALPYWQQAHERVTAAFGKDAAAGFRQQLDDAAARVGSASRG